MPEQVTVTKRVPRQTFDEEQITAWRCQDGKTFPTQEEAEAYEERLRCQQIVANWPMIRASSSGDDCFLIQTPDELKQLAEAWEGQSVPRRFADVYHSADIGDFLERFPEGPYVGYESAVKLNRWQYDEGHEYALIFFPIRYG